MKKKKSFFLTRNTFISTPKEFLLLPIAHALRKRGIRIAFKSDKNHKPSLTFHCKVWEISNMAFQVFFYICLPISWQKSTL